LAQAARQTGDHAAHEECMRAAERMDWEAIDEVTALGTRYRVVRAEQFICFGGDGPESPRPTDPDPGEPDEASQIPDPATGFVIDPAAPTGPSDGMLKLDLLGLLPAEVVVPREVRDDAERAARTHPGGVLLPPAFMVGEQVAGQWRAGPAGPSPTPQGARDALAGYLRIMAPWQLDLDIEQRAVYDAAAERMNTERTDEIAVAERRFRIVRVERLVRIGPDGPEGSRPSDPDPQPPVKVNDQQLREQGLIRDDEDENAPIELSDDAKRFGQLFYEEEERRKARIAKRAARRTGTS
jgi:Family of unknown function (DUF5954)